MAGPLRGDGEGRAIEEKKLFLELLELEKNRLTLGSGGSGVVRP